MSAALIVRAIAPDDHVQWRPLWDGYNRFYGRFDATALPEAVTRATWRRFFAASEPVHALVAERDGRLIGLVHYLFHRSTTLLNDICYLQDLFTDETARGGGIGRALIEAVYEQARASGSERVYWQTHESNARAMVLYNQIAERSGFLVYRKAL
ncbi:MAG TPA: GNAT family N-acetyltransferase [Rhizomicrobium sp.]|jgi:GNAT superfamily N-acetyltransferase|nr:GNAT family N-acetyltransferase [Rhizomicrobium sp.]